MGYEWLGPQASSYASIESRVRYFGGRCSLACDGRCDKAWGLQHRPKLPLADAKDEDDFEYLADHELGQAPEDPGIYECDEGKPRSLDERHNKWCARACERAVIAPWGQDYDLPDFSKRVSNKRKKIREPWMTPQQERRLRKWSNWSGHFAWGGFLALAAWLKLPHFPAVGVSIALGAAWELLYWKFSDSEDATGRACFIDWAFWIMGAVAGGLLIVYFG